MVDGQREVFNPNIGTSIPDPNPDVLGITGNTGASQAGGKGGVGIVEQAFVQQQEINQAVSDYSGLEINGILGGLPVAEKNQEYFIVFDEAGDTSPEIPNQTQFKIIYIVDSKLNVGKPAHGTVALSNLTQNFEPQKFATIRADQGTALNPQLVGTYPITAVGSIAPIIGTQVGKGPLQYVTTMSFQLNSQIGLPGGIPVAQYNFLREKTWGYNNITFATASEGTYSYTNSDGSTFVNPYNLKATNADLNPPELELGSTGSYRMYYDISGSSPDGEAVSGSASGSVPSFFNTINATLYNNEVTILTGSLEGNTRVKVGATVAIAVATSSVVDIFNSYYTNDAESMVVPLTLRLIAETSNGTRNTLATFSNSNLNVYNSSVDLIPGTPTTTLEDFAGGTLWGGFDWKPTYTNSEGETRRSITWVGGITGFIDVVEDSKIYAEVVTHPEFTGPKYPGILNSVTTDTTNGESIIHTNNLLTGSLDTWKDTALTRTYEVLYTRMRLYPEFTTNRFVQGVTGVTASYYDTEGSASLYNYTGSYWVGSTNTTSSKGDPICYITASTKLASFYGGEYTQINPGTEVYNNFNLEQLPSSSLVIQTDDGRSFKKNWFNAGFNPLRLPFVVQIGDFIRFEYSPDKTYQIIGVFSSGNRLFLTLDRHLASSTVVDNFVIYRIIKDGQYIILNVEKDIEAGVNQAFRGIILPEYPSEATSAKQDELIFELKKAGIIEDGANNRVEAI